MSNQFSIANLTTIFLSFTAGALLTGWLLTSFFDQVLLDLKVRDLSYVANALDQNDIETTALMVELAIPHPTCELQQVVEDSLFIFFADGHLEAALDDAFKLISVPHAERTQYCSDLMASYQVNKG